MCPEFVFDVVRHAACILRMRVSTMDLLDAKQSCQDLFPTHTKYGEFLEDA